jgi:metal-responsive CopG/Arc/MetJ family transcriptional regulator
MAAVKTAISLEEPLFEQAEALARALNVSRSRLYALALETYIQRYQAQQLLQQLNEVYADGPDAEETILSHYRQQQHRRLVDGEW